MPRDQADATALSADEVGRHPGVGTSPQRVPAPDVGWHAPAHRDRGRARMRPEAAVRRRADDRARRHRAGADPQPARSSSSTSATWRWSSSPTTSASSPVGPTTSRSCTQARSSRRRRPRTLFAQMRMPYTEGLLKSIPKLEQPSHSRLEIIGGRPPDLINPPVGCKFSPRCPYVQERCRDRGATADRGRDARPLLPLLVPGRYRCGPRGARAEPRRARAPGRSRCRRRRRAGREDRASARRRHASAGRIRSRGALTTMAGSGTAHLRPA